VWPSPARGGLCRPVDLGWFESRFAHQIQKEPKVNCLGLFFCYSASMLTVPALTPEDRARIARMYRKMAISWVVLVAVILALIAWEVAKHRAHGFGLYWQFGFAAMYAVMAALYEFRARRLQKVDDLQ
jgi:cytochrome bd-type quinol oxidase subunit 2